MTTFSKLVIAPHIDDEVLGCTSVLDSDTFVYFCGYDESYSYGMPEHRISSEERLEEVARVAVYFGYFYFCGKGSYVNAYQLLDVKDELEAIINQVQPEQIYIHQKGFNQDHNTVYDAAMIALRPHDQNFFVKKVMVYESVHDFQWPPDPIEVNYYIPVDITKKIEAYLMHASQVRSYRSEALIYDLARLRGASGGMEFAEAFKILRWVE